MKIDRHLLTSQKLGNSCISVFLTLVNLAKLTKLSYLLRVVGEGNQNLELIDLFIGNN